MYLPSLLLLIFSSFIVWQGEKTISLRSSQGLAVEKDEMLRWVSSFALFDSGAAIPVGYGSVPAPHAVAVDVR